MKRNLSGEVLAQDVANQGNKPRHGLRSINCYTPLEKVGQGTYGKVFRACRNDKMHDNDTVAIKKINMNIQLEGFPLTALREITLLKELNHKNIVKLIEVLVHRHDIPDSEPIHPMFTASSSKDHGSRDSKGTNEKKGEEEEENNKISFYVVLEFVRYDLLGLIKKRTDFTEANIKDITQQLLEGIQYCHDHGVIHRDIKPSNLLLTSDGTLKIIDFGLAKRYRPNVLMSLSVITLWYRPPEILLGDLGYGYPADIWSIGCIVAELFAKRPLFAGKTEAHQLDIIIDSYGGISETNWPGVSKLPGYEAVTKRTANGEGNLRSVLSGKAPEGAVDFIMPLLSLDPAKRPTAREALEHPWFKSEPRPQRLILGEFGSPTQSPLLNCGNQPLQKLQKVVPQFLLDPPKY